MSNSCQNELLNDCQIEYHTEVVSKEIENKLAESEVSIVKECSKNNPKDPNCKRMSGYMEKESALVYPFNASFLKFGTFHQNDRRFKDDTMGNQCTCNDLVYIGDQVYRTTVEQLKRDGKYRSMLLNFNEIPNVIETGEGKFKIIKKDTIFGSAVEISPTADFPTLHAALTDGLKTSYSILIMIGAICSAVHYHADMLYFFDSHSHSNITLSGPNGSSIHIRVNSIDDLVSYLYSFYTSIHIDLHSQFEILPVSFVSMDIAAILDRQIESYFDDQLDKQHKQYSTGPVDEEHFNTRATYMKQYMQKRRTDKLFRERELDGKRRTRKI